MTLIDNKTLNYIIILEILILIIGAYFGVWRTMNNVKALNQSLTQKEQELAVAKDKEEKLTILKQEMAKNNEKIELLSVAVPDKPAVAEALMALEAIAVQSGAEIIELNPVESETGKISINFSSQADFSQMKNIFNLLYKDLRPVEISEIKVIATGENDKLTITLTINMPYLADGESADTETPITADSAAI